MDWEIREAGQADTDRLALIGGATFLETFAGVLDGEAIVEHGRAQNSAEAFSRFMTGGARAWLAEVDPGAAPVGFALLTRPDLPGARDDGSDLELKRIYLLSRFHGSGIGAALMEEATAAARGMGAARLMLGVYAGNAQAIGFYRKIGFQQIAVRRFTVGSCAYDDHVFAKAIG